MKLKIATLSFLPFVTAGLFAQIDPGIHMGTISGTSLNKPSGADASWIFQGATFTDDFAMDLGAGSGYKYEVELNGSSANFSSLNLNGTGTNTLNLSGVKVMDEEPTRTSVSVADGWVINIKANGQNELRLNGYADINYKNFKIASDSGDVTAGGSGGVTISGASNRFTATAASYIGHNGNSAAGSVYFNISGVEGAKSSATFNTLAVRASGDVATSINMKGNATFTTTGTFDFATDTSGGKATLEMTNSGNELTATAAFFMGSSATGGAADAIIGGTENIFTANGAFNVGSTGTVNGANNTNSTGGTFTFSLSGSQNQFVGNSDFNVGRYADGSNSTFELGGTGNSVSLATSSEVNIGRNAASGDASLIISGSGNTFTTQRTGNSFFIGANQVGGSALFEIGGTGNTVTITGTAYVGSDVKSGDSSTGKAVLKISGSGHNINFNGGLTLRANRNGNTLDSTALIFAADKNGFSTLNTTNLVFDAVCALDIDLRDFVGDAEGGTYSIVLISAGNNWNGSRFNGTSENGSSAANVIAGSNIEEWELVYAANQLTLTFTYTGIPEPSTYAAIFGALALGFAAYRRRK